MIPGGGMTSTRWSFVEGLVGTSPTYVPFKGLHQSRSYQTRLAICYHGLAWPLCRCLRDGLVLYCEVRVTCLVR